MAACGLSTLVATGTHELPIRAPFVREAGRCSGQTQRDGAAACNLATVAATTPGASPCSILAALAPALGSYRRNGRESRV
jgi:hypothetical protein